MDGFRTLKWMQCKGFPTEDYGMYVLGSLALEETRQIDEHVGAQCSVCITGLRDSRKVWNAVGAATSIVPPRRALRRRVVQSVGGSGSWWSWQPWPVLAGLSVLLLTAVGGWYLALRPAETPQIAFAPVYRLSVPDASPSPEQTPARIPQPQVITREVPVADPAIAQSLAQERQKSAQLEAQLAQQRIIVANAQKSAQDSDRRYQAALEQKSGNDELQRRLAAATARSLELERQVSQYRVLLETQRKRLDQNLQLASLMSDPTLRIVRLRGTEKSQSIEGHALLAGGSQLIFYASQLPPLPANRTYQLWVIRSRGPAIASAGTFNPDSSSHAVVQLKDPVLLSAVTSLAVTDEPMGGSAQPTGHKWMIGL
jgi:anti-sigma-K factor RskA